MKELVNLKALELSEYWTCNLGQITWALLYSMSAIQRVSFLFSLFFWSDWTLLIKAKRHWCLPQDWAYHGLHNALAIVSYKNTRNCSLCIVHSNSSTLSEEILLFLNLWWFHNAKNVFLFLKWLFDFFVCVNSLCNCLLFLHYRKYCSYTMKWEMT